MATETYQKRLQRHLAEYRVNRLGVEATGTYTHNKVTRSYGHILPAELRWLNIPEPFRLEIRAYVAANPRIKLHDGFHHLNSSQAFTFALFYPYLTQARGTLANALGVSSITEWKFEMIPDDGEKTNVDILWESSENITTFCEVKLSEAAFGPADDDARHKRKLKEIYAPVLGQHIDESLLEPKRFFKNYQVLRNLWLAARKGHERDQVMFLMPKANTGPVEQLNKVLQKVREPLRSRVTVVHVESLLQELAADRTPGGLGWYAAILAEKYLLG